MKFAASTVFIAIQALGAISNVAAGVTDFPVGVQVLEEGGVLTVREATNEAPVLEKRCRECKNLGEGCTIGHGSCKAQQKGSCTWCGNHCKSICIPSGESCVKWCL